MHTYASMLSFGSADFTISFAVDFRCEDRPTRKVLSMVRDLYALDRIWKDIGTYRNQDYIAPNKAKVCFCSLSIARRVQSPSEHFRRLTSCHCMCRLFIDWLSIWASNWREQQVHSLMVLAFPTHYCALQLASSRASTPSIHNMLDSSKVSATCKLDPTADLLLVCKIVLCFKNITFSW